MSKEDDELQGSQTASESTPAPETVSDDELSRAFDDAVSDVAEPVAPEVVEAKGEEGEAVAEEPKEEEKPPVETEKEAPKEGEEDHKERTKLGRKVAKLEDTLSQVLEQNRILLTKLTAPQPEQGQQATDPSGWTDAQIQERYDELHMESPFKANQFLRQAENARTSTATVKYQSGYLASLKGWQESAEDEGETTEVYKLLTDDKSPFNVKHSASPDIDFQINLAKATAHYYKNKVADPQARANPLDKNKAITPKGPLGVAPGTKPAPPAPASKVKIDPEVAEYAKAWGFTEEDTAKLFSGSR